MTSRLTNAMRGQIVQTVLKHRFDPIIATLAKDYAVLAYKAYSEAFKKTLDRMNELPDGWLPTNGDIQVEIGAGRVTRLYFNGRFTSRYGTTAQMSESDLHSFGEWGSDVRFRFPANKINGCVASFEARHVVSALYDKLTNRKVDLLADFSKAQRETSVAIGQYTTIDKLLDAWPEIRPFTLGVAATPKPQLPVVQVETLNSMLGLPVT